MVVFKLVFHFLLGRKIRNCVFVYVLRTSRYDFVYSSGFLGVIFTVIFVCCRNIRLELIISPSSDFLII